MINRVFPLMVFALLGCVCGFGQSSYKGLTPGKSTKADVQRVLGQPSRVVSETLSEYQSQNQSEKIFVQYRPETSIVERIEAIYPATRARAGVLRALQLPALPTASQTNGRGKFEEYFAAANIVLTYASGEVEDGIARIGYFNPDLFESAVASVPRPSQNNRASAGSPLINVPEPLESPARVNRSSTPSTGTSTQISRATTGTRPAPTPHPASESLIRAIPSQSIGRSAGVGEPDSATADRETASDEASFERLVGDYEFFDAPEEPLLQNVLVEEIDGRLKWIAGPTKYLLIPGGTGQLADAAGVVVKNILQFRLEGKPGVKVQFTVMDDRVEQVSYLEEQAGKVLYVLGRPKP